MGQDASDLLEETGNDSAMSKNTEQSVVSGDMSRGTAGTECTTDTEHRASTRSTDCHMSFSDMPQGNSFLNFVEAIQKGQQLTEEKWLQIFGITEKQLRGMLEPIATHILSLFCFLNTGQLLENTSPKQMAELIPCDILETFRNERKPAMMTLLKLLVVIIDQFQSNKFFFCDPISHIPYYFSQEETIRLNFNPTNICFEIYNKLEMRFGEFESVKISINFGCIVDQIVIFEKGSNLEFLAFDVPVTKPPAHIFTSFIVHNMSNEAILVPEDSLLGHKCNLQTNDNSAT